MNITNAQFYQKSYNYLLGLAEQDGLSEKQIDDFINNPDTITQCNSLNDVFKLFTIIAQDYQSLPKVINARKNKDVLRTVLFSYNYQAVLNTYKTADSLFQAFAKKVTISNVTSPGNLWLRYSKSLLSFCSFLSEFHTIQDFHAFIQNFSMNRYSKEALPLLLEQEVYGLGFALACNLLKELGYMDYPKPDTHTIDVMEAAGFFAKSTNPKENQIQCYKAMQRVADDAGVKAYTLDKVIWLICSGDYYRYSIKVNRAGRKDNYIKEIKKW